MNFTPELSASLLGFIATFLAVLASMRQQSKIEERLIRRIDSVESNVRSVQNHLEQRISDAKDILRAEFIRVEQVMDARIKHLEER
jgi:hypothetical protein